MIVTDKFVALCGPLFGLTVVITGVPAVIVNPFTSVAISPPVVIVTLPAPVAAVEEIEMIAVALVAEFTVKLFTVTPAGKSPP